MPKKSPGFDSFPILKTQRLTLRPIKEEDVDAYRALLADPEVTALTDIPDSPNLKQSQRLITWMMGLWDKQKGCAWALERHPSTTGSEAETANFIGAIRINRIAKKERYGTVGYELAKAYWQQGFMTEALRAVVTQAHNNFELNRLEAWTLPGNAASDKVLLKCGFQHEGTLRQKAWFKGTFHDLRMFGRLSSDEV